MARMTNAACERARLSKSLGQPAAAAEGLHDSLTQAFILHHADFLTAFGHIALVAPSGSKVITRAAGVSVSADIKMIAVRESAGSNRAQSGLAANELACNIGTSNPPISKSGSCEEQRACK